MFDLNCDMMAISISYHGDSGEFKVLTIYIYIYNIYIYVYTHIYIYIYIYFQFPSSIPGYLFLILGSSPSLTWRPWRMAHDDPQ